jgi:RNA polymerase sigma-70 factor (ECF subfamily)
VTTPASSNTATVENLFRREAGRMSAAVVRLVGLGHLDLAEDIVHDALVQALEIWKYGRLPENPAAWLMTAAKNRAIDVIRRERTARRFAPELAAQLSTEWSLVPTVAAAFEDKEIVDAELRLMFELCHGRLPEETQVMVILKYLCGFGVRELSQAFLTGEDAIEKRLVRARATLQAVGGLAELGDTARVRERATAVCRALYLMFNEGYHGSDPQAVVREELCAEALRLGALLADHPVTGVGEAKGLLALMCLLAARLPARRDADGDLIPLDEQDRAR